MDWKDIVVKSVSDFILVGLITVTVFAGASFMKQGLLKPVEGGNE